MTRNLLGSSKRVYCHPLVPSPLWFFLNTNVSELAGNVRTEPGTGNRVMKEPEPEEPVTRTEPVEP